MDAREDATVKKCPVDVRDHGSDVASAVCERSSVRGSHTRWNKEDVQGLPLAGYLIESRYFLTGLRRRVSVAAGEFCKEDDALVEEERVALVERVDLSAVGDADVGVGEDELSDTLRNAIPSARVPKSRRCATHVVESVAVHSLSERDDHVGTGAVHAVTSGLGKRRKVSQGRGSASRGRKLTTISFPGRRTSSTVPVEPSACGEEEALAPC